MRGDEFADLALRTRPAHRPCEACGQPMRVQRMQERVQDDPHEPNGLVYVPSGWRYWCPACHLVTAVPDEALGNA